MECEVGLVKLVLLGFYVNLVLHVQTVHWDFSRAVELSYHWGKLRSIGGQYSQGTQCCKRQNVRGQRFEWVLLSEF